MQKCAKSSTNSNVIYKLNVGLSLHVYMLGNFMQLTVFQAEKAYLPTS